MDFVEWFFDNLFIIVISFWGLMYIIASLADRFDKQNKTGPLLARAMVIFLILSIIIGIAFIFYTTKEGYDWSGYSEQWIGF